MELTIQLRILIVGVLSDYRLQLAFDETYFCSVGNLYADLKTS